MVIKKADVTEEMKNMLPIRSKDIGCGSKILVLKKYQNGEFLSCLERYGERINFTRSKPLKKGNKICVVKRDGILPSGSPFARYVSVEGLVAHRRVRTANEVIPEQLSMF